MASVCQKRHVVNLGGRASIPSRQTRNGRTSTWGLTTRKSRRSEPASVADGVHSRYSMALCKSHTTSRRRWRQTRGSWVGERPPDLLKTKKTGRGRVAWRRLVACTDRAAKGAGQKVRILDERTRGGSRQNIGSDARLVVVSLQRLTPRWGRAPAETPLDGALDYWRIGGTKSFEKGEGASAAARVIRISRPCNRRSVSAVAGRSRTWLVCSEEEERSVK